MPKNWVPCALAAAIYALLALDSAPANAEYFGCNNRPAARHISYSQSSPGTRAYAQVRPRVTIYPRHRSERLCRSWLVKEYRISGPVIVPRMRCWWQ